MKYTALILLLFISSLQSFSQTYWIPKTPFFDFLYKLNKPISKFYFHGAAEDCKPIPLTGDFHLNNQKLIKTKKDLFVLIEGTGIVFKATGTSKDKIAFTRIDSTIYHGYNFNDVQFAYNDTIFSLGGYGFWKFNGQLRFFHHLGEWSNIPVNNEHPVIENQFYFSEKDNLLITVQHDVVDQNIGTNYEDKYSVIEWDLINKQNKIIGYLKEKITLHRYISCPYLNGLLMLFGETVYLFDFQHNKIYKAKNDVLFKEMIVSSKTYFSKAFALDNKIYFTKDGYDSLDSITVSMDDFEKESTPIYTPFNANKPYYIIFGSLSLLMIAIYFIYMYKKKKNMQNVIESSEITEEKLLFTSLEKLVIESVHAKSLNNQTTTVEEINELLGLSKKTIELKKRVRTEIINSINQKFKTNFEKDTDLILRDRSTLDKRYFQYTINAENIEYYLGTK